MAKSQTNLFVHAVFPVAMLSGLEFTSACGTQPGRLVAIEVQAEYHWQMLHPCFSLMDKHTLLHRFRNIVSLASLTYTFTALHTIQYSMRDHDNNNAGLGATQASSTAQTPLGQDYDSANHTLSTHDTPTTTSISETAEKSGRWTENKIRLLLKYVEKNCTLTTARGLSLKKSEFNKARAIVKSKDSGQCHYKWGHVRIFIVNNVFHCLSVLSPIIAMCYLQSNFAVG